MDWTQLFTGQPAQQPAPQQQQQQPPAQPQPKADPGFQQPADIDPSNNPQQAKSPIDQFTELFNNEPQKDKDGKPVQQPTGDEPYFNVDPAQLNEVVNKMDFIPKGAQELVQAVQGGDLSKLPELLNAVMRAGYSQQTQMSRAMMEDLGKNVYGRVNSGLSEKFRTYQSESKLQGDADLNHPAIKPVANALAQQVRAKYPNASADEVTAEVQKYFKTLGTMFSDNPDGGANQQQQLHQQPNQYDWAELFGHSQ